MFCYCKKFDAVEAGAELGNNINDLICYNVKDLNLVFNSLLEVQIYNTEANHLKKKIPNFGNFLDCFRLD